MVLIIYNTSKKNFNSFLWSFFSVNSEGLTPLDVAVMTNNIPMAKMLLFNGARESPLCKLLQYW